MIQIIDLENYLQTKKYSMQTIENLEHALKQNGYVVITGHGISSTCFTNATTQLAHFFDLPERLKKTHSSQTSLLGYIPPKSTLYTSSVQKYQNTKQDLNETFLLAVDNPQNTILIEKNYPFIGPNPWPEQLPSFKKTIIEYQKQMHSLGKSILPLIAKVLNLPSNFFYPFFNETMSLNRFSYYPIQEDVQEPLGIAPHTDHGFITLLPLPKQPGLQVFNAQKIWQSIPNIENGILLNIGDFLEIWSNGVLKSPLHRVISPKEKRYSLTFFFNPHPDTIAEPQAANADPIKYQPISMLEYLNWYRQKNYTQTKN